MTEDEEPETCVICLQPNDSNSARTGCLGGHSFHDKCIRKWWRTEGRGVRTCPTCRENVATPDEDWQRRGGRTRHTAAGTLEFPRPARNNPPFPPPREALARAIFARYGVIPEWAQEPDDSVSTLCTCHRPTITVENPYGRMLLRLFLMLREWMDSREGAVVGLVFEVATGTFGLLACVVAMWCVFAAPDVTTDSEDEGVALIWIDFMWMAAIWVFLVLPMRAFRATVFFFTSNFFCKKP